MSHDYLYRGFNSGIDISKAMEPKNPDGEMETYAECGDERVQCGDADFTCGKSVANTIHSHEYGGNGQDTSGISTTPFFDRAKVYALGNGKYERGTVLTFSRQALLNGGIEIFRIKDVVGSPAIPEDDEYWIYFEGDFPMDMIVEAIPVCTN
jgi:hypothetical protein